MDKRSEIKELLDNIMRLVEEILDEEEKVVDEISTSASVAGYSAPLGSLGTPRVTKRRRIEYPDYPYKPKRKKSR